MRRTRGWCASGKSPTPAFTYRSLPRSRKKVSVRTVASAATNPAALTAICPLAEKRFLSNPPQLLPELVELVAEPLEQPTKPVLLGEPLNVFCRPLGGVSHGGGEFD